MLLVAAATLVAGSAFDLLKPWPLKFVFDYLLKDQPVLPDWLVPPVGDTRTWSLAGICLVILAVWSLSSLASFLREYLLSRLGEEVAFELRVTVFGHIQRLSLAFHDSRRLGDMMMRVTGDTNSVRELVTGSLLQTGTAVCTVAGMLAIMLCMDWQLAMVGLVTVPILCPVVWRFRKQMEEASKTKRQREVEVSSVTQETMSSLRLVKAFGREEHQQQQFKRESSASVEAGLEAARLEAKYTWAVDVIGSLGTCAVVWWGVHRVFAGSLTPGDLYVFVSYIRNLYGPLRDLAKQSIKIAKGKVGLARVLEVLEMEAGVQDSPRARVAPRFRGQIEFRDVSFAYVPGQTVLEEISFTAEPGQCVALVGYSGAGKSTIMSLIPRLYDPTAGQILIDGQDLRSFKLDSLREQIGVVLQESLLFQTSVLENVLYGRPDASPREVEHACRAAGVDQFVERLPDGYRTVVGQRGATLSGGERQRVAIARTMIRGTPILLLDEPTTGLDVRNELLVINALERLMEGKTTLLISHKLTLIDRADKVLVVDAGRIVESGRPAELRAAGGFYARLHELSASGVLESEKV
jgi:ABC-type multidrug transport system fused ATPase/permease subunit